MCVRVHVCGWVMESSETNEEVEKGVPSGKGSVSGLYVCRETANKDNTGDPPPPKKKRGWGGGMSTNTIDDPEKTIQTPDNEESPQVKHTGA